MPNFVEQTSQTINGREPVEFKATVGNVNGVATLRLEVSMEEVYDKLVVLKAGELDSKGQPRKSDGSGFTFIVKPAEMPDGKLLKLSGPGWKTPWLSASLIRK